MNELNEEQMKAVCHQDGPMLVLAGPGSGKTTMITHRVLQMTGQMGIHEDKILVVTYTRAAAQEMRGRFLSLKGTGQTNVCFGTFHSVFLQMLREQRLCPWRRVASGDETIRLMAAILKEEYEMPESEGEELAEILLSEYSRQRNTADTQYLVKQWSESRFRDCVSHYETRKKQNGWIDFDDMLSMADQMLMEEEIARYYQDRYPYILVDEFQDINPRQYKVLKRLAGTRGNVFAVGDDDQAIYGFRGASPLILQQFPEDFPGCRVLTLKWNYRSTQNIIAFSGNLIRYNRNRYEKKMAPGKKVAGMAVRQEIFSQQEQEATAIAEYFQNLHRRGMDYDQMAVLLRTSYQAEPVRQVLEDYGIGCQCRERFASPFAHWTGEDVAAFWRAARGDREAFEQILFKPERGIPQACMTWISQEAPVRTLLEKRLPPEVRLALEELFYEFRRLKKERPEKGFHRIAQRLKYDVYLQNIAEKTGIPVKKLRERFDFFQREAERFASWQEWEAYRQERINQSGKDCSGGVRIMTLHSSKGLEFSAVWIPGIEQGALPHERSTDIEEERRLFYVGCTRARQILCLSWCKNRRGRKIKPSVFWKEGMEPGP